MVCVIEVTPMIDTQDSEKSVLDAAPFNTGSDILFSRESIKAI